MPGDKKFFIGWKTDTRALKESRTEVKSLAAEVRALKKATQEMQAGFSGAGAKAGLSKALLGNVKGFKEFGVEADKVARILKTNVSRATDDLTKNLQQSVSNVERLVRRYEVAERLVQKYESGERIAKSGRSLRRASALRRQMSMYGDQLAVGLAGLQDFDDVGGGTQPSAPGRGAAGGLLGGVGGGGSNIGAALSMMGLGGQVGMFRMLGPLGIAAAVGVAAAKSFSQGMSMGASAGALGASGQSAYLQDVLGRDAALLRGQALMTPDDASRAYAGGTASGALSGVWAGMRGLGGLGMNLLRAPFGSGTVRGAFSEYGKSITAAGDAAASEYERQYARDLAAKDAVTAAMADPFKARQQEQARYVNRYGARAWEGAAGYAHRYVEAGRMRAMTESISQFTGTRGAVGYQGALADAVYRGYSDSAAANIIGSGAAIGGGLLYAHWDQGIAEMLGSGMAGYVGPNSSYLPGAGRDLARFAAAGVGGGSYGMRQANQNLMGLGAHGSLQGGFDAYQRSFNLATATNLLSGGSVYQQNYLATAMSNPAMLAAVMAGDKKALLGLSSMGIDVGTAQAQGRAVESSIANRFYGSGSSPAELMMRSIKGQFGGDFGAFIKSQGKNAETSVMTLAPLLTQIAPELFGDEGTAAGFLRTTGGLGAPAPGRGKKSGDTWSEYEKTTPQQAGYLYEHIRQTNEMFERLNPSIGKVNDALDGMAGSLKTVTDNLVLGGIIPQSPVSTPSGGQ